MSSENGRIAQKKDFENIFRRGKTFKGEFLVLKACRNFSRSSRFAFIVSQKVSKKATVRNKIRRQLKELTRLQAREIKKGVDCVFIVLPGLKGKNSEQINSVLGALLKKAGLVEDVKT